MRFTSHAATIAAVTLCAGALANAATPIQDQLGARSAPVQVQNPQEHHLVPALESAVAPGEAKQADETVQPLPQVAIQQEEDFATLSAAVAAQDASSAASEELHCLATGVYYESKSEPLAGQLAVAEVILNRARSGGRFPSSVCSVLTQPGQFSFVRGGKIPTPPANAQWRKALAVAKVAQADLWDSPASEALYFHARYSKPGWGRAAVVTIGNHVFYR
jgi:spore germination cell wall hydrolase CwlJ-like protein